MKNNPVLLRYVLLYCTAFFCLGRVEVARADIRLAGLFSDNMVLQQGDKTSVWGWADDGEKVTVTFRKQTVSTIAKNGQWSVTLKHLKPGTPDVLRVAGKNSIEFKNVLVGEVWVCSGQSNMAFLMEKTLNPEADIASATNTDIRFFEAPWGKASEPAKDLRSHWLECSPLSVKTFSAVAYYFGHDLQKARGVPIGLISASWGGSPVEVWIPREVLAANPRYTKILAPDPAAELDYQNKLADYEKEKTEAGAKGSKFEKKMPHSPWRPAELYNGMIAPLRHCAIAGVIWYQGEANVDQPELYRWLFTDLIRSWRTQWAEGDFPFLFVQLPPYDPVKPEPAESARAELRESQWWAMKTLPKVGMAVTTDVGEVNNIHPKIKKPVGERLALAARAIAYGEKVVPSGPIYNQMKVDGDKVTLSFNFAGGGLVAKDGPLTGFAICGGDHKFVWAAAAIEGKGSRSKVVVSSPRVEHPIAVRYGWADFPVVNLWNTDGLPASPFRTDDFPVSFATK